MTASVHARLLAIAPALVLAIFWGLGAPWLAQVEGTALRPWLALAGAIVGLACGFRARGGARGGLHLGARVAFGGSAIALAGGAALVHRIGSGPAVALGLSALGLSAAAAVATGLLAARAPGDDESAAPLAWIVSAASGALVVAAWAVASGHVLGQRHADAAHHAASEARDLCMSSLAPDVLLVDINLPGLSGIECVRQLKPRMPNAQFLMVTAYEDTNNLFEALAAGATGYLLKGSSPKELLSAIREIRAGGSPMSISIARKIVESFQHRESPTALETPLSSREMKVLDLLATGELYKEIADTLGISVPTVSTYVRRIYEKLHVRSRAEALVRYAKMQRHTQG